MVSIALPAEEETPKMWLTLFSWEEEKENEGNKSEVVEKKDKDEYDEDGDLKIGKNG